ncbi:hypothetical protein B0H11DRAFT_2003822, partial [Mycena galericulata]
MASCLASSSWSASKPLRPTTATWNTKFPAGLALDLSLPSSSYFSPTPTPQSAAPAPTQKPRLRLPVLPTTESEKLPTRRFDPFADEPPFASSSSSQNTPPPRGRPLTPLAISTSPPTGRRRAPSFSAGTPRPAASLSTLSSLTASASSPAPSASRVLASQRLSTGAASQTTPHVPLAPTPFHARHYPTPDARARLLARTLLNRIHAVGRPRSLYSCSSYSRTAPKRGAGAWGAEQMQNGYEEECGGRGYVRSRLSECVVV